MGEEAVALIAMRNATWLVAMVIVAAPAFAQSGVAIPVGQNLPARREFAGDVVLDIDGAGGYALNDRPVTAAQLAEQLAPLIRRIRDRVVYIRADAHLSAAAIDAATAIVTRDGACVASFIAAQERGTVSRVRGDAGPEAGSVRRAVDVQLPLARPTRVASARQEAAAIVLEVLPGPAYRINSQAVPVENLERRLLEIFNPRPIKVLYLRANAGATYQDVFRALDAARYAGVVDLVAAPPDFAISTRLPDIDLTMRVTSRDDSAAEQIDGNIGRCRRGDLDFGERVAAAGPPPDDRFVYFEFQVEQPATVRSDSYTLRYPDPMRASHTNGEVLAQFVVDTNGLARPETFKALKSTNVLFTQAVRNALPDMRFTPATIGGRPVRQLVQKPFYFTVTP
jgi:biopolymer transport protein ExbD